MKTNWKICHIMIIVVLIWTGTVTIVAQTTPEISPELIQEYDVAKVQMPGFQVESIQEFSRMKQYRQEMMDDGVTVHQFTLADGSDCRCIDVYTQSALDAAGISPEELTFEPVGAPPAQNSVSVPSDPELKPFPMESILDGSKDAAGRVRKCPRGSFPKLIPSLVQLCQFKRLEDRFRKYPGDFKPVTLLDKQSPPNPSSQAAVSHVYAVAQSLQDNTGVGADLNLWSPFVEEKDDEFSLCQIWESRGNGNDQQTTEAGWQVYRTLYHDDLAHFFIYYTTNNYGQDGDNRGCYNLDCAGFVQTSSDVTIGAGFNTYSTDGGTQYYIGVEYFREPGTGHWWLRFNGSEWVGYYPGTLFDSAGLGPKGASIDFGGEVIDDNVNGKTATDMGSGKFPTSGFGYAAFASNLHYYNLASVSQKATGLSKIVSDSSLYDMKLYSSTDASWNEYFYFGGPGANRTAPTLELYYENHDNTECFAAGDIFDGHFRLTNSNASEYNLDLYIVLEYIGNYFFWPAWTRDIKAKNLTVPASNVIDESFLQFFWPGEAGTVSGMNIYGVMMEPNTYNHIGNVEKLALCALGSGDISFQLNWTYTGSGEGPDLDLHVTNPNGYHIYYSNKSSPDGGQLDFDDRGECGAGDGGGPENIFWETGRAPHGRYVYGVVWYSSCGSTSANYTITVRTNGNVAETQSGTISSGDQGFSIIY